MSAITEVISKDKENTQKIQKELNKQNEPSTTTQQTQTVVHKHETSSALGAYQREVMKNPNYWKDLMTTDPRSFTPTN